MELTIVDAMALSLEPKCSGFGKGDMPMAVAREFAVSANEAIRAHIGLEKALQDLKALEDSRDFEVAHYDADIILSDILTALGMHDIVEAWAKIGKWYA